MSAFRSPKALNGCYKSAILSSKDGECIMTPESDFNCIKLYSAPFEHVHLANVSGASIQRSDVK